MLAIAGCSEDNTHPKVSPVDEPSADAVTILATIDAIPSATGDGEAYAPLWQEGDQIIVGYKGMSYVYETYDAGNGVEFHPVALSLPADARGEVTAYFKAVDGVFAVGADQTGATLPMYAYAADAALAQGSLGLHFKPLASVLSLTIGEEASKTISKITLEPVDPDGVEGHLAVSEAVVDPRTGAVTVGEDAAVSDILTMEIGEMSLVQAQTVNFLIASGTKVDGGLKATISCTDGSVFVKNLFETQEVAFAGNCVGAVTELFFRLRIATYEDMVNFAQECADDNGGAIVDLQADIDMRNVPWTPIENFTGTFNGNGHRIYNINVSADGRYAGFFAYAKGAISDVVFGSKDGTSYDGTSRIELKYSADTDTWCYAGIVAQSNNTLTGVTSFVPVTVTADSRCKSRTGGIVGSLYNGKMSGCRNYGAVSNVATAGVASYVAGIAGIVDGSGDAAGAITLDGCHNHGPVMTSLGLGNAVAGITASVMKTAVNTTISNCTNAGEIRFDNAGASAAHRIGGIVAYIVDSCPTLVIDNCTNKGTVVSNMNGNCFIGGIAGVNYAAAIRDCTNEAEVKFVQANAAGAGYLCIGGIAGQTYSGAKVTGCANRAAVSSDKLQVTRIGGIVGTHNASTIDDCSNSGDITLAYTATANNWEAAGGIVGFYDGTDGTAVTNGCTNSGKVSATVNSSNANIGAGCRLAHIAAAEKPAGQQYAQPGPGIRFQQEHDRLPGFAGLLDADGREDAVVQGIIEEQHLGRLDQKRHERQQSVADHDLHAVADQQRQPSHRTADDPIAQYGQQHTEDAYREIAHEHLEARLYASLRKFVEPPDRIPAQRAHDHGSDEHRDVAADDDAHGGNGPDYPAAFAGDVAPGRIGDQQRQQIGQHRVDQACHLGVGPPSRGNEERRDESPRDERADVGHDHAAQSPAKFLYLLSHSFSSCI